MNNFSATGNIGTAGETKFVGQHSVTEFSVAVKSGFGDKAVTTWIRCQLWGKRGETVAQYLTKGALVGISGELTLREYDKKDGTKGASLECRLNDVTLLGGKKDSEPRQAKPDAPVAGAFEDFSDDIPFVSCSVSHDIQSRTERRMSRYD